MEENKPQLPEDKENQFINKDNKIKSDADNDVVPLISPIGAAFIGLIGGFFLYQIVGGLLTVLIFGFDLESIPVNSMRLLTMAGQILFILLPALIFAKWIYLDVGKIIRIRKPAWQEVGLFALGIVILTPLLQSYLYIQNHFLVIWAQNSEFINSVKNMLDALNKMVDKTYANLLTASNIFELIFVVIVVAVVPAISEEAMFRGFIQRSFELKLKPYLAILLTAIFFSAYHFNPYGFIPLFILGAYFGFTAYMTRSLVIPVILHFLNNFSAVLLYHILGNDELLKSDTAIKGDELSSYLILLVVLTLLFVFLIAIINKYYSFKTITQEE
jgi:membrane protease YdiL (CAAX protease family)